MRRREFLKQSAAGAAVSMLGRAGLSASAADTGAKVALVRTENRAQGIAAALKLISFPSPSGKKVLIKPNFNTADPTPGSTHNDVLRQLVEEMKSRGASRLTVGDSCGPGNTKSVMEQKGIPVQCNSQSMTSPWNGQTPKPTSQTLKVADTQVAQVSASQAVVLNLTTNEGDTVSLSLAARTQSDYLNYLETGQNGEGSYARQLQLFSTQSEQGFTLTVEGDLSQQERQDIGKALKTIDRMMSDFVQGRLEPMMAKANKLTQLDTISGLSLQMSFTQDVLLARQTEVQNGSDPLGTIYNSQGQLTQAHPAIASQPPESAQLRSRVTAEADDVSTAMAKQLTPVRDFAQLLHGALTQIFDKYRQRVEKLDPDDAFGSALIERMHKNLLAKTLS